jgi:hypothetical protein
MLKLQCQAKTLTGTRCGHTVRASPTDAGATLCHAHLGGDAVFARHANGSEGRHSSDDAADEGLGDDDEMVGRGSSRPAGGRPSRVRPPREDPTRLAAVERQLKDVVAALARLTTGPGRPPGRSAAPADPADDGLGFDAPAPPSGAQHYHGALDGNDARALMEARCWPQWYDDRPGWFPLFKDQLLRSIPIEHHDRRALVSVAEAFLKNDTDLAMEIIGDALSVNSSVATEANHTILRSKLFLARGTASADAPGSGIARFEKALKDAQKTPRPTAGQLTPGGEGTSGGPGPAARRRDRAKKTADAKADKTAGRTGNGGGGGGPA